MMTQGKQRLAREATKSNTGVEQGRKLHRSDKSSSAPGGQAPQVKDARPEAACGSAEAGTSAQATCG